jgi:hypothetical protein
VNSSSLLKIVSDVAHIIVPRCITLQRCADNAVRAALLILVAVTVQQQ